jgi:hypothetical protein
VFVLDAVLVVVMTTNRRRERGCGKRRVALANR